MPEAVGPVADESLPDVADLQADEEGALPAVPVEHRGPIQTQELPARTGAARSFTSIGPNASDAVKVLDRNLRRKRALIVAKDQDVHIAYSMEEIQASTAAVWLQDIALEITHTEEVWVRSAAGVGTSTFVSVFEENWTR